MKRLKCKYCAEEWYIKKDVVDRCNACPFCLKVLREKTVVKDMDSLDKVIYFAITDKGLDLFSNAPQLCGYFLDIAPNLKKEIHVFSRVFNSDYLRKLKNIFEQEIDEIVREIEKLKILFVEDEGVAENWANMLCDSCLNAAKYLNGLNMLEIVNAEIMDADDIFTNTSSANDTSVRVAKNNINKTDYENTSKYLIKKSRVLRDDEIIKDFNVNKSSCKSVSKLSKERLKLFQEGISHKQTGNYQNAFRCFNILKLSDDSEVLYELGEWYYYGRGTNENLIEAELMYRKSNKIPSLSQIEEMYKKRSTISPNAYEFYKKLAEQGSTKGQFFMGYFHQYGICTSFDTRVAVEYYKKAAEGGLVQGLTGLGICYLKGIGVHKDLVKAKEYLEIAVKNNDKDASTYLEMCKFGSK